MPPARGFISITTRYRLRCGEIKQENERLPDLSDISAKIGSFPVHAPERQTKSPDGFGQTRRPGSPSAGKTPAAVGVLSPGVVAG